MNNKITSLLKWLKKNRETIVALLVGIFAIILIISWMFVKTKDGWFDKELTHMTIWDLFFVVIIIRALVGPLKLKIRLKDKRNKD